MLCARVHVLLHMSLRHCMVSEETTYPMQQFPTDFPVKQGKTHCIHLKFYFKLKEKLRGASSLTEKEQNTLACAFPDQARLHTAPFKGLAPKWGLGTIGFWTVKCCNLEALLLPCLSIF